MQFTLASLPFQSTVSSFERLTEIWSSPLANGTVSLIYFQGMQQTWVYAKALNREESQTEVEL